MFVEVKFDIVFGGSWRSTEQKVDFWNSFQAAERGVSRPTREHEFSSEEIGRAEQYEQSFRMAFPGALEGHINDELQRAWEKFDGKSAPKLKLRLVTIEYGSLKAILDIAGIDNSDVRDFVLSVLTIYSPIAFRTALSSSVTPRASARIVGEDLRLGESTGGAPARGMEALSRAWVISNTSLLVPVGLALLICYFAFSALTHGLESVKAQNVSVQSERTEILKALVAQNAKASELLAAHANNSDPNFRALSDVLITLLKSNIEKASSRPPNVNP